MKKNLNRKGIWIPLDILENTTLDSTNKILLSEILSLTKLPDHCFASNKYFGELLGLTRSSVSKRISFLQEKGFIKTENKYENNHCVGRIITEGNVIPQKNKTISNKKGGSSFKD
ncbi:helix-turn-helix domain-containing protein [Mariniradius sediminis]|uniref:helix-turn-helix domain-containing protein n=1 Tax=Mariniradius sediminis TaxID=2909237 RepID=UPI003F70738C